MKKIARIDIKGDITSDENASFYRRFGINATCPADVKDALATANGENIDIYINSPGGEIFAASEIYSELRAYKGNVKIHIVGIAASAASVIACAAKSDISPTGMMMIHNVSSYASGDYRVMDHTSELLVKANRAVCAAYTNKTGRPEDEMLELMNKESWLTAQEVVEMGLVDEIAGKPPLQEDKTKRAETQLNLLKMRGIK